MKIYIILFLSLFVYRTSIYSQPISQSREDLKKNILLLAEKYQGTGDPDLQKQKELEGLVKQLLIVSPQEPVSKRLDLIEGSWQQIWGPYDYSSDNRGVEPSIDVKNIYQVVFKDGYYYNVNPNPLKKELTIGLLRGEYWLDTERENVLNVKFTKFNVVRGCPGNGIGYLELPFLSETKQISNEFWFIPGFVVRLFFGGGSLREVYTDKDIRITYGSEQNDLNKNFIFILKRVANIPINFCK